MATAHVLVMTLPFNTPSADDRPIEASEIAAHFHETKVRLLLAAEHGEDFGQALLAISAKGSKVVIELCDGNSLDLSNPAETAQALLEHFEWKPSVDMTNRSVTDCVHGICQKLSGCFTLRDVINRLLDDKPDMLRSFGSAWGWLTKHKVVRIFSRRKPFLYELGYANSCLF